MPIHHAVEQRGEEWFRLRVGLPTASDFAELITPGGKPSKQCTGLAHKLLAEAMTGHEIETPPNAWMLRGQELEPKAREAYEFTTGATVQDGGFFTDDAGLYGASPDGIVGTDGLVEIKCPAPNTHMGYLIDPELMRVGKAPQVQGQLLVTGRQWVDLVSYHPEMPLVIVRVTRDEEYVEKLRSALEYFAANLSALRGGLEEKYGAFPDNEPWNPGPVDDSLGVSDADIDAMVQSGAFDFQERTA